MRPSWDWEHVTVDASGGTPGHTGHTEDPEDESFFQAGDEGRYEGGPALLDVEPIELDEAPVAVVRRTPEQDARRARLVRVVAMAVGAFAALFAFGVVKQQKAGAQEAPPRVSRLDVPPSSRTDVTPHAPVVVAPRSVKEPAAKIEKVVAEEPVAVAKEKKPIAAKSEWSAPAPAMIAEAPSAPAAKPVTTTSVTAIPKTASGTTSGGNVGNFASRGPGTQVSTGPSTPTAAFPTQ